ncbi:vWA domain-containing protein [Leekyejoonella antrihumi]|uniref:VWA domain-containing protein n=1 Tax=Leekyejoonella antrihumi TaxID=1660198 RepID=A0A563DS37_9MICO|nr:VWA domain-containing protein [Leekyejoonella antrihumi]TWP33045.1 VWA domain-containing protein [Leekyejoonella antrihumi]
MATAPDVLLLGFARALRAAGVPVTPDRERGYLDAVAVVGLDDERATYWAGRSTLCSSPDELERYDKVFTAWFSQHGEEVRTARPQSVQVAVPVDLLTDSDEAGDGEQAAEAVQMVASPTEVLRHRDIGAMSPAEKALMATLFGSLHRPRPVRRSARHTQSHHGAVDARRTLRAQLERMGEPGPIQWRRRSTRPRHLVLLIDVSGSMSSYAESLLRLAHHWVRGGRPVEVFTMGTRLTRITRALHQHDPDRALIAAGDVVPDWSGGTRLGESVKAFLDRWGRRGMARGAIVVIFSDGWERSGVDLLDEQMRRLRAMAHRVVWVNPHAGKTGYEPVQQGILAVLPHCDGLVAGHSLQAFNELAEMVDHA